MRNTSEKPSLAAADDRDLMRATFEVPRSLVAQFRALAARRERTFSGELRKLMTDEIERDQEGQTA